MSFIKIRPLNNYYGVGLASETGVRPRDRLFVSQVNKWMDSLCVIYQSKKVDECYLSLIHRWQDVNKFTIIQKSGMPLILLAQMIYLVIYAHKMLKIWLSIIFLR